jgi:hypothetical protein
MTSPTITTYLYTVGPFATPAINDISAYVREMSIKRGRENFLDPIDVGTCTLILDNRTGRFDPNNTSGAYSPNLLPMRRIVITASHEGGEPIPLFYGYVKAWPVKYDPLVPIESTVEVECNDGLNILSLKRLQTTWPVERTSERLQRVLSEINWTLGGYWMLDDATTGLDPKGAKTYTAKLQLETADRSIGTDANNTGSSYMAEEELVDIPALSHVQDISTVEDSVVFCDGTGKIRFHSRLRRVDTTTSTLTFGDSGAEIKYTGLEYSATDEQLYTEVVASSIEDEEAIYTVKDDAAGIAYCRRTLDRQAMPIHERHVGEAKNYAEWLLYRTKAPTQHVTKLTVRPHRDDSWASVLALEIGDRVTVTRRYSGAAAMSRDHFIEGIDHKVTRPGSDWEITFSLSPAWAAVFLALDVTTIGLDPESAGQVHAVLAY